MTTESNEPSKQGMHAGVKQLLDLLPIVCFFVAYKLADLLTATAVMVVATVITLSIIYLKERRVALLPLISGGMVCVFGTLTLLFNDETFIKMRPTVVNGLFGVALLLGVYGFRAGWLKHVFSFAFTLNEAGWLKLSRRWGVFFLAMAALNEIVWRNVSTETWVDIKVFGYMALTMLFTLSQMGWIAKQQDNA